MLCMGIGCTANTLPMEEKSTLFIYEGARDQWKAKLELVKPSDEEVTGQDTLYVEYLEINGPSAQTLDITLNRTLQQKVSFTGNAMSIPLTSLFGPLQVEGQETRPVFIQLVMNNNRTEFFLDYVTELTK